MASVRLRRVLADIASYQPARALAETDASIAQLANNEMPYRHDANFAEAVSLQLQECNRYPDPQATDLRARLADHHGLNRQSIVVGCGSVQLIKEIVAATCDTGTEVIVGAPSFEVYPLLARLAGAVPMPVPFRINRFDLDTMAKRVTRRTRVIMLCSPNNPTGSTISHDDVRRFLERIPPEILVLLDEAYAEFVTDPEAVRGKELLGAFPNLVVLRTFSKAYGLAGLRVGYALLGSPDVGTALRRVHLPFSVNVVAQAGALAALRTSGEMEERVTRLTTERDVLVSQLRAQGWSIPQAQGNFVWLSVGAASVRLAAHFERAGLLTRCYANEGVRVTVGTSQENLRVANAAREWIEENRSI